MYNHKNVEIMPVGQLFSGDRYVIPMYQRNYAWGETEIHQLVRDVLDYYKQSQTSNYYIGTLVTFRRPKGEFEVIDGQQRFTTLCLLAIWFKWYCKSSLTTDSTEVINTITSIPIQFECRPHSDSSFRRLFEDGKSHGLNDPTQYNQDLIGGYRIIDKEMRKLKNTIESIDLNGFYRYLIENVKIARVQVPKDTDLNHYFEVMNNRGEQLEMHEVVKARLMGFIQKKDSSDNLNSPGDLQVFAKIWDACADMNRYVQYGFEKDFRSIVFGSDWSTLGATDFDSLRAQLEPATSTSSTNSTESTGKKLGEILEIQTNKNSGTPADTGKDTEIPDRFQSIINFPNFLIHALWIFTKGATNVSLDDKQLLKNFEVREWNSKSAKDFCFTLLKCRFLFDQHIIKRESLNGKDDWSLKSLILKSDNAQYKTTFDNNQQIIVLQAAFHVSYSSQAYKYWLLAALNYLYKEEPKEVEDKFLRALESIAKNFVFKRYLANDQMAEYDKLLEFSDLNTSPATCTCIQLKNHLTYNTIRHNFIFNYLDYLIWSKHKKNSGSKSDSIEKFRFTSRSSVEHFSPQNPMEGYKELDHDTLHSFGNLCLISHSKNSRLSNFQPSQKSEHFESGINRGEIESLKLYLMLQKMKGGSWDETAIKEHENEMLALLCENAPGTPSIHTQSCSTQHLVNITVT